MKNSILLSLCSFLLCLVSCEDRNGWQQEEVSQIISSVQKIHAPDKRVAWFQIESVPQNDTLVVRGETILPKAKEELIANLAKKKYPTRIEIEVLPAESLDGKIYGVVNLSACNIRSNPKHSAELGTQSTLGTILRVFKEESGWFLIQTPDDYFGWLDADGFTAMTAVEYEDWQKSDKVVYVRDFGFSFTAPTIEAERVSDLLEGNILKFLDTTDGYAKVAYPDGRVAFIPATEVMNYELWLASRQPTAENILAKAKDLLGRPYLWGGTSGKGMDCSGFTKTVFYLNGVIIPRDASQQVHAGVDVETDTTEWKNLEAGDLLFFGTKAHADQKERITHVAIYVGNGKIIHAAGTIKIESILRGQADFNDYRVKSFVRAKRFLNHLESKNLIPLSRSPYYAVQQ